MSAIANFGIDAGVDKLVMPIIAGSRFDALKGPELENLCNDRVDGRTVENNKLKICKTIGYQGQHLALRGIGGDP